MKSLKAVVLAGVMAVVCGTAAHADTVVVGGDVASIHNYTFLPATFALGADMTAVGHSNVTVGTLTIDNNDPEGFRVSLSSLNSGVLVRYNPTTSTYYPSATDGNTAAYSLTFAANASPGVVGAAVPASFLSSISLTTAQNFDFSNPTVATVAAKYDMKITQAADTSLLNSAQGTDVFQDVITVTVSNL